MNHVFIVTYGRTGSTALQNALNALPGFSIRGENGGVVAHLFKAAHAVRTAQAERPGDPDAAKDPWFGVREIDADALEAEAARVAREQVLPHGEGIETRGFKEIRHGPAMFAEDSEFAAYIDFLIGAFANARIIFLTRRASEVSGSGWWSTMAPHKVEDMVAVCNRRFAQAAHKHGGRAFTIDHADFNNRPDGLRPLLHWLGHDLTPEVEARLGTRLTHLGDMRRPTRRQRVKRKLRALLGQRGAA